MKPSGPGLVLLEGFLITDAMSLLVIKSNQSLYFFLSHFFKKINLFNLFILAVLGLHCCAQAFSSCSEWGLLFVVEHGLWHVNFSSCGTQAQ